MFNVNVLAVLVATVVVFLISGVYYAVLGKRMARLSPAYAGDRRSAVATVVVELIRGLVLSAVIAGLAAGLGLDGLGQALLLTLALWVAFPAVLLTGSVFHERVPPQLAAIHGGDWLVKLIVIAGIVILWP